MAEAARAGKGRLVLARILTILAVILATIGMVAFYVKHTMLDEGSMEAIATEMIQNDDIREQIALTSVEQLYANVDVEQAIAARLPEAQKGLAPVLAGISRQAAEQVADRVLQRPRIQQAFVLIVDRTQRQLVRLLDDKTRFIQTEGGQVVLDIRPLVIALGDQVAVLGNIADRLPPTAGRIVIMDADQLESAQRGTRLLRFLSDWLWIIALALAAVAVWLARGRRRLELRALAIGVIVVGFLMLLVRRTGGTYLVDRLTDDSTKPAGSAAWNIVTQGLADRAWVWIVLGALALTGVWLVGTTGLAAHARRVVAPVAANPWATYGCVAGLVVILAALVPLFARGWLSFLIFIVLLVVGVEVVRRVVLAEEAAPERGPAGAT